MRPDDLADAWKRHALTEQRELEEELQARRRELEGLVASLIASLSDGDLSKEQRAFIEDRLEIAIRRSLRDLRERRTKERRDLSTSSGPRPPESATRRRVKSLERFGYWRIPEINRWLRDTLPEGIADVTHQAIDRTYAGRHADGDDMAMFDYAREDAWCFRSTWFTAVLEEWRDAGRDADLRRLMRCYAGNASKTGDAELRKVIERDQEIFARIVQNPEGLPQLTLFGDLAGEFGLEDGSIRLVYEQYKPYWDAERASGLEADEFFRRLREMASVAFT